MRRSVGLSGSFIGLILLFGNPGFASKTIEVDAAINRGLAWTLAHPATCEDGGYLDIVDEGLFYLVINHLTLNKSRDVRHEGAFQDCISRLEASPEFKRQVNKQNKTLIEHYHLLLATRLIETARGRMAGRDRIIAAAQRTLASSRLENPTFRLTVALLLQHLGATPQINIDNLLDASLVNRVANFDVSVSTVQPFNTPYLLQPLAYYALVHEVAALTDFGRIPVSPWLMDRRSHIQRILQRGSRQAMASAHVDLLAELILCNHMLGLPVKEDLLAGVGFLVASQHPDGTWGEQPTPRSNRVRHTVHTATAALLAYRSDSLTR